MRLPRSLALLAILSTVVQGEPTEVFGGEFAVGDGLAGFTLDLNADGFFDINFAYFGISVNSIFAWDGLVRSSSATSDTLFASDLDKNDRLVQTRFTAGNLIGPADITSFSSGAIAYEVFFDGTFGGPWLDQERGYVGFSFLIDGSRHFGWAEVEIDNSKGTDEGFLILYRVGYETAADTPIAAGAPLGCNAADLAPPFGAFDIFDVLAFLDAFNAGEPAGDITGEGSFDIFDVLGFLDAFNAGCP